VIIIIIIINILLLLFIILLLLLLPHAELRVCRTENGAQVHLKLIKGTQHTTNSLNCRTYFPDHSNSFVQVKAVARTIN
jgi:hypothetical protein